MSLIASHDGNSNRRLGAIPRSAKAASTTARVADPSSREIQVSDSSWSRDNRRAASRRGPMTTISFLNSGSISISGPATNPLTIPSSARWERSASTALADVASSRETRIPGCACWNCAITSGSRYVPLTPAATIRNAPEPSSRNSGTPSAACARTMHLCVADGRRAAPQTRAPCRRCAWRRRAD